MKTTATTAAAAEAEANNLVHLGKPPRADDDPLSCLISAIADRVERLVGQLGRAVLKEVVELPIEVVVRGHAVRSWDVWDVRASASRLARSARLA